MKVIGNQTLSILQISRSWPLLLLFFVAMVFFNSCKKEKIEPNESLTEATDSNLQTSEESDPPGNEGRILNCPLIKQRVYNDQGVLVFTDMQHFWDCVECLERDYDTYNDNYEAKFPNATAEQLDVEDENNRFDHWTPFIDFERSKAHYSLRASIEASIVTWLAQQPDSLDFNANPDLNTPIIHESIRTLFNSKGYVRVGRDDLPHTYFGEENKGTASSSLRVFDDCAFSRTSMGFFDVESNPVLNNRLIQVLVGVRSGLVTSNTMAKCIHFKRINNKWKRRRGKMALDLAAIPSDGDCNTQVSDDWFKYKGFKNRRVRNITASIWLKWRENFARMSANPARWNNEAARATCIYENQNNLFPVRLIK